jgi:hypothetical protein
METSTLHPSDEPAPIAVAVQRARADYLEMPGLRLTAAQARRLWTLDADVCEAVLTQLVDARFLSRSGENAFVRT